MSQLLLFIGTTELLLIGGIALLLFGGKKLPEMMRGLGQGVKEFKKGVNDIEAQPEAGGDKPAEASGAHKEPHPQKEDKLADVHNAQPKDKFDNHKEDNGTKVGR